MQKTIYVSIICIMAVLAASCTGGKDRTEYEPQLGDTAYTGEAAMRVYATNPDRALLIIDSAVIVGNLDEDLASMLRAKVYCQSSQNNYDTARYILEHLLNSKFTDDAKNHEIVLDLLVIVARGQNDNVQYLRWATEKADFCRHQGLETEALRTEAEVGVVLCQLGEVEKSLAKLNSVIAGLDGQRHFNEMDACIIALKRKINVLNRLDRSAETLPLGNRIVKKISDYRMHPADYADNSYRMPHASDDINKYCDFYTSQAYGFIARAYATAGNEDSARHYLTLFEQSDYSKTLDGKTMLAPVYRILGDYHKMQKVYDEIEKGIGDDTITYNHSMMLFGRAQAAEAAGNLSAANGYWKRYIELNKHLNKKLLDSRAYEYAARYHLQEEQMNTERERSKTRAAINWAISGFLIALLSIVFTIRLLMQHRAISRKNRVLVEKITETAQLKSEREKMKAENETDVAAPTTDRQLNPEEMSDEELFSYISGIVRSEKLYLDPLFERQILIDRLNINKNRIGAAFAQGSKYKSLSDFVRDLRLEHACRLLTEQPDMSIGEVATASGFSSTTVFGRDFKNKYEVSPTLFRTQKASNE